MFYGSEEVPFEVTWVYIKIGDRITVLPGATKLYLFQDNNNVCNFSFYFAFFYFGDKISEMVLKKL